MASTSVVFGAGKIARGFIGHILHLSGFGITFVEVAPELREAINARGRYTVHILGSPEKDTMVGPVRALAPDDPAVTDALGDAAIAFVSVGGANLDAVAGTIAAALAPRLGTDGSPLNIIVCENWRAAARTLREAILAALPSELRDAFTARVGIAEATIMRSAIAATPEQLSDDPASVQSQDFWLLPLDADALVGSLPPIQTLDPVHDFGNALERKLYTYNTGNATISFLGWLRGHTLLAEAASDPVILAVAKRVYDEMGRALVAKFGFDPDDQVRYAARSLAKFQDAAIVDPIVRQIADPIRKLGPGDRLVGASLTALDHGVEPRAVAVAIAAALRYRNPDDPAAVRLGDMVEELGELGALAAIADLPSDHPLLSLVAGAGDELARLIPAPSDQ